jgi:hypothetical protein
MTKPKCRLIGEDGNSFGILGRVIKALRDSGQGHLVSEFKAKALSGDYNNLLRVCLEYVEDVSSDENKGA